MTTEVLHDNEINQRLSALPDWQYQHGHLCRSWVWSDFKQAMGFILQVAFLAEAHDHHPVIHNVYNRVDIQLRTHQPDGITERDFALAHAIQLHTNPA